MVEEAQLARDAQSVPSSPTKKRLPIRPRVFVKNNRHDCWLNHILCLLVVALDDSTNDVCDALWQEDGPHDVYKRLCALMRQLHACRDETSTPELKKKNDGLRDMLYDALQSIMQFKDKQWQSQTVS